MKKRLFFITIAFVILCFGLINKSNMDNRTDYNIETNINSSSISSEKTVCFIESSELDIDSPTKILIEVGNALSNKDFDKYRSLVDAQINSEDIPGELQNSHEGMYNYKKLTLIKYKEILPEDCGGTIKTSQYTDYDDIHIYAAKYNCEVYQEDAFFFNGINYVVCVVGNCDNKYKLIDFKKPALSILSPNARFYEDDEKVQLFIENQRINHGNIIGSDGSLISQNAASPEKYDGLEGMTVLEYVEAYPDSIKE